MMQRRRLPVQVEPLSPQRWAKIERGLFAKVESGAWQESELEAGAEPPPPRRWLAWAAMAAAVALALGFTVLRPGDPAASEAHISRITTGRDGSHLALHGVALDVEPESTVVVNEVAQGGLLIVVDRGSIVCDVAPRSPQAPLIVQAGAAQVRVVGTRFKVQRVADAAQVTVEHGVVEVAMGGRMARVAAGQVWPAPEPASPSGGPTDVVAGNAAGARPSRIDRSRSAVSQRRPALEPSLDLSPQARFERAAALERTSPSAATALYRGLEAGSDSWAANALFAHGRLELARGNQVEARRLLEHYLARFPRGANSSDARALLQRVR